MVVLLLVMKWSTAHCILDTAQCTTCCTLNNKHCTVHTSCYTLHNAHCTGAQEGERGVRFAETMSSKEGLALAVRVLEYLLGPINR